MTALGGSLAVLAWSTFPRSLKMLWEIMDRTPDADLERLSRTVRGPGGKLAWAELGRRRYGVAYAVAAGDPNPFIRDPCSHTILWS